MTHGSRPLSLNREKAMQARPSLLRHIKHALRGRREFVFITRLILLNLWYAILFRAGLSHRVIYTYNDEEREQIIVDKWKRLTTQYAKIGKLRSYWSELGRYLNEIKRRR